MKWKQFLTPVKSMNSDEAQKYMEENSSDAFTLLDVRQPEEYNGGHIPGAKLIPLPDLTDRIGEIEKDKPTIVYCAIGGRSRVAAQMLAGKEFKPVYNLSGGFKSWGSNAAYGGEAQGLDLFSGKEAPEEILVVAYSLEVGLQDFYQSMIPKINNEKVKELFLKLSKIEVKHQARILDEYQKITGKEISSEVFEKTLLSKTVEGGMTTEEYINMFQPDIESPADIIGLAMSIEAQALDLYQRTADNSNNQESKNQLLQIASEERAHLSQLGTLMGTL